MFLLGLDDGIARLVIDRPEARNAIPASQWAVLAETAGEAVALGARLLLVEGAGSAFCAGADLGDFPAMRGDAAAAARFREAMGDSLARLATLPIPTVALIEGACYGAGVALALACDIRIAGPAALFAVKPARFGISFTQPDIARLVALVGRGQASRLLLGAQPIDAAEAARIGLVELLAAEPGTLASAIASNDARSLEVLKRGIALATAGVAADHGQDRAFDALLASDALAARLAGLRRRG